MFTAPIVNQGVEVHTSNTTCKIWTAEDWASCPKPEGKNLTGVPSCTFSNYLLSIQTSAFAAELPAPLQWGSEKAKQCLRQVLPPRSMLRSHGPITCVTSGSKCFSFALTHILGEQSLAHWLGKERSEISASEGYRPCGLFTWWDIAHKDSAEVKHQAPTEWQEGQNVWQHKCERKCCKGDVNTSHCSFQEKRRAESALENCQRMHGHGLLSDAKAKVHYPHAQKDTEILRSIRADVSCLSLP